MGASYLLDKHRERQDMGREWYYKKLFVTYRVNVGWHEDDTESAEEVAARAKLGSKEQFHIPRATCQRLHYINKYFDNSIYEQYFGQQHK